MLLINFLDSTERQSTWAASSKRKNALQALRALARYYPILWIRI